MRKLLGKNCKIKFGMGLTLLFLLIEKISLKYRFLLPFLGVHSLGLLNRLEERFKEKIERLKACFYALEIGTAILTFLDKIFTFVAITYYGAHEINPYSSNLMSLIGLVPALIIGFLATIFPMLLIHYGIRRFKWNKEGHYWIFTLFMVFYFSIFYKLVEKEIIWFGVL